jgi:superfamily II DNA or RNA helicase
MGESFEAKLIAASSKEVFKKAKQILHSGGLLCCHEIERGVLRAVCRDAGGLVAHAEIRGFPNGPFSGTCTCRGKFPGFCPHSMAAALYHAKYTIKKHEEPQLPDLPVQFAGLRFVGIPELLTELLGEHPAHVELESVEEYPHAPSKWENVHLHVNLVNGSRIYAGNQTNLRQLHFDKTTTSLRLEYFSPQDRQIIRFLAINAEQLEHQTLSLTAEQCTEFFHSLPGFTHFVYKGQRIIVHPEPAVPVFLLEKLRTGFLLRSAVLVKGAPLPLKDVKVIAGRSGCWVGMLGEYWWLPARNDVAWIRNFLRTTIQPCDDEAARILLSTKDLPIRILPSTGVKVRERKFRTVYDGRFLDDGTLELTMMFNYGSQLCSTDATRFGSAGAAMFWLRNTQEEELRHEELIHFGFSHRTKRTVSGPSVVYRLNDREAVGMFIEEVIPRWEREGREFLLNAGLASLAGENSRLTLRTTLRGSGPDWFELGIHLSAGGAAVRWNDLTAAAARGENYLPPAVLSRNFVRIPDALRRLAASLQPVVTYMPGADDDPDAEIIRIPRQAAYYWADAASELPGAVPVDFLRLKLDYDSVLDSAARPELDPAVFHGKLREYQKTGVAWLDGMSDRGCNLILADEMGLGKTVQLLAFLAVAPQKRLPALVVCPTTLVGNWAAEIKRFLPGFRTLIVNGPNRGTLWEKAATREIVITSYALVRRDIKLIGGIRWSTLILDEAQHIKNPLSLNARTCKSIPSNNRVILTGTPLENSAEDLWSMFDFLHPGLLGSLNSFREKYSEIAASAELKHELVRRISPFMLRRRKSDVCLELPPKQEQLLYCDMESPQRKLYQTLEKRANEQFRQFSELESGNRSITHIHLLASIMRMRQVCCAPELLPDGEGAGISSAKLELLNELLLETLDSGHKVLIFSQFTSMLSIIRDSLAEQQIDFEYLDGSTHDRAERIDRFNSNPDVRVFLLSLKAGGVGINLTSADTVIIFDPWWNPAVEDQAADRTHRIGQTRSVNIIRLVVRDSIEERILALHERKRALFNDLVEESTEALSSLSMDDVKFLLDC